MNNNNLSKEITWTVILPKGYFFTFEDSLLLDIKSDNEPKTSLYYNSYKKTNQLESYKESNTLLLDILQEVYYVTHFAENNKTDERLYYCDKCWNELNVFWRQLLQFIREREEHLDNEKNYEYTDNHFIKDDNEFQNYIKNLGEPFITRYHFYKFFKFIYSIYNYKISYNSDIVYNINEFRRFWNTSMYLVSSTLFRIQISSVNELKQLLKKITKEKIYYQFRRKYIHRNSCFSLTKVLLKGNEKKDILCFSGIDINNETIKKAIDKIMRSSIFSNSYLVSDSDDIRYYLSNTKYITYGDAKSCKRKYGLKYENRMFSCCERKTIADFNWDNCLSFEMFVKYKPCELCKYPINELKKNYNGNIYHGIKCNPLKREKKKEFQEKARKIYNMIHKI